MSGSPKYSTVHANAQYAQRIEAERRRREQIRQAEQARRAQQALEAARAAVARRLAAVVAAANALHSLPGVDAAESAQLRAALDQARALLDAARDPRTLVGADHAVTDAEALRATVATNAVQRTRSTGRQQLTVIRSMLGELRISDRSTFDSAGRLAADRAVATLEGLLTKGDTAELARATNVCAETVRAHHATVTAAVAAHAEKIREIAATTTELRARLRDLWHAVEKAGLEVGGLAVATEVLDEIQALLDDGDVDTALAFSRQLPARIESVEQDVDDAIDRATERREMLREIVSALPDLGFAVDPASLVFGEDGSVAVQAQPRRGEPLLIAVHDDAQQRHRVNYMRAGDEDVELDDRACDSLLTVAEQVNAALRQGGFDTGDIHWDEGAAGPRTPGSAGLLRSAESAPDSRATS
ncbi:hypothetical protein ACFXHA_03390 [Nocardia sp. NPDC059240]|uniref:hypothetical protein n=1 Tax=Nocardia sp. NPDC059240 TaxID=3346786 RepID=UPI003673D31A